MRVTSTGGCDRSATMESLRPERFTKEAGTSPLIGQVERAGMVPAV